MDPIVKSQPTHAAVRFFSCEARNISIVPLYDVEDFDPDRCSNEPYYIKRYEDNEHFHLSPGELLSVGSRETLENNPSTYKFKKRRRSDAVQLLRLKARGAEKKAQGAQKTPKKAAKALRAKLKKLGQIDNGRRQLRKFLNNRKLDSDSENDIDITNADCVPESAETSGGRDEVKSPSAISTNNEMHSPFVDNNRSPVQKSPGISKSVCNQSADRLSSTYVQNRVRKNNINFDDVPNSSRELQGPSSRNKPLNETAQIPLNNEPPAGDPSISPDSSSENDESQNRSPPHDREGDEYVETPRRNRRARNQWRRHILYRLKRQIEVPSDLEEDDEFHNLLRPETRDVDFEERELYQIEGDEIYVGCNKVIQVAFWEYMKHRGHWVFLRELLAILWDRRDLVNRCIKESKVSIQIEGRSPRKCLSPNKYKVVRRLFKDYLNEMYRNSSKKKSILRNMNRHIGYKIRDLRRRDYEIVEQ